MIFCTCSRGEQSFAALEGGGTLWVHAACNKPTRMVLERLTMKRIPQGATAVLSVNLGDTGVQSIRFRTHPATKTEPAGEATVLYVHSYDRRPYSMGINPTDILLDTWERLDDCILTIKESPSNSEYTQAQGRAYANVLASMMYPFFTDADAIVKEGLNRWENRDNPDYETPGLGSKSLDQFDAMPKQSSTPAAPKSTGNVIPDGAVNSSRQGITMGMFTVKQIADSYDMTPDEVKSQLGLV